MHYMLPDFHLQPQISVSSSLIFNQIKNNGWLILLSNICYFFYIIQSIFNIGISLDLTMPHYSRRSRSRSRSHHRRQHGQASKTRHQYYDHYRRSPRRQARIQVDLKQKKRNTSQYRRQKRYSSRYQRSSSSSSSSSQSSYSDSSQSSSRRNRQYHKKHRSQNKYHKPQHKQERYHHRHDKSNMKEKRYEDTEHHREKKKYESKNPSTPYIDSKHQQREYNRKNYEKNNYDKNYSKQSYEPRQYKPHPASQNQQGRSYSKNYVSPNGQQRYPNSQKPQQKPIQKDIQKEYLMNNQSQARQKKPQKTEKQISIEVPSAVFIKRTQQAQEKCIPKKQKISEIQQILCKAKQNLQVKPLQPNFMILDSFKTMNHIKAEALDSVLTNPLKQAVQSDYETKKAQIFGKDIQILPEASTPIVHINQEQSQTEKKMFQNFQALKANTAALSQMFRQLLLAQ